MIVMRKCRLVLLIWFLTLLTACVCGPARWAEELEFQVRCGMSAQEVEQVSGRKVEALNRSWATHYIHDDWSTDVWLTFKDDRLQSIQVAWVYALKKMASAQRVSLCPASP